MEAIYTLNIYANDDEIEKTYGTNVIRWGIFKRAVEIDEKTKNANEAEQIEAVSDFMLAVFPGITKEEIERADTFDIFNVFKQIIKKAESISKNGGNSKN